MTETGTAGCTSLADPALSDKIDSLFACNVGDYIDLPQLVVVGLTRLPFPRDSGLCTRFATQLIFRRDKSLTTRKIHSSIIPSSNADSERERELRAWGADFEGTLSTTSFARTMKEVHKLMDVSTVDEPNRPTFSTHVFRLEICGPDEDHLSVIDVPGIFKIATPGSTTKADIRLVRNMVLGYMKNPRSIMLTVVAANVDVANQEIIEIARDLDPEDDRTLGVLTKPDLVDKGAKHKVLDIVAGRELPLKHGKEEMEQGIVDRDSAEADFEKTKLWNTVAADRYGISSLKSRLQETVTENARRAFPLVRTEINQKLKEAKTALAALGSERNTTSQQLRYLLDAITRFNAVTAQALSTHYGADKNFDKYKELRLATLVVNREVTFARSHGIYEWLRDEYHNSRGFELNNFSITMLTNVFNKQTMKWKSIALGYLSEIIFIVHNFIMRNLQICFADRRVFRNLLPYLMGDLLDVYKGAMDHVWLLLYIEREGTLKTLDHYFNDQLQKIRQSRWKAYVEQKQVNGILHVGDLDYRQDMSNESHTVQDLHDILGSYYKVAMNRFVDNVSMQAADYHLVNGLWLFIYLGTTLIHF
ncbi:hypothetical protein ASPACDRAFT_1883796 [Aspergillus aculeatus ATCC 16872]|uniref:GED domain-containing protein n=1 Tax=Aspergillus aculeatus (strain ATCC 16872 / CBS 172.66 / WB 5094) TaxID=690307 RepID=A0A1L9WFC9_ASPA1|nr:uncharacterized protein ASPACDRAFT_1883796 [Aspergillus aculeatus ATCC 16872]OJJ94880.1 hypothetical protein ASPACDRAFT_1883796 [Aspergillus aculeatus ATCC 16872]